MNENKKILRFVLHQEIEKYEAMGYRFASHISGHHGQYSVVMEKADGLVPRNNKNIFEQKNRLRRGKQMIEEKIGNQRLICGNGLELAKDCYWQVDHLITDPPYEQSLHDSKNKTATRKLRNDNGNELSGLDFAGIDSIRKEFIDIAQDITEGWFITFCTIEGVARWADFINPSKMKYKRACIWVKPDATPQLNGQCPAQGAECFVTAWCGQGHSKWNGGGKRGIYTFLTNAPERDGRHPTEKPVKLMSQLLVDFTQPQQTILDPFMGSGTTLVSCQMTGRHGIGIEKSKEYFDIACDRVHRAWSQPDMFVDTPQDVVSIKGRQHKIL